MAPGLPRLSGRRRPHLAPSATARREGRARTRDLRHNEPVRPFDPRLLRYARSARGPIAATAALGTLIALAVIAQALLISRAAAPVIEGRSGLDEVLGVIALLALIVLLRGLLTAARDAVAQHGADRAIRDLRSEVLTAAEELGPRWRALHAAETATLLTRGLDDLGPYFVKFLPQLVLTVTATPLALAVMLLLDPWSGVIALVVIPLIPIFMILIGRFTQDASAAKLRAMEQLSAQLLDLMAGLPTLRGLGRAEGPRRHLRSLGTENTRTTMATLRIAFLSGAVLEFLATISVALVAVEVGMRLVYGNISLGTGLAVIMLAPEVFEPLRQVGAQFHASANGVAAARAAFEIIEDERPAAPTGAAPAPDAAHCTIELEGLSVAARGAWAPAELSARIEPGRLTVLAGRSGAGKTTTVLTILGLLPPTKGRVLLARPDGAPLDLGDIELASWWAQISWVPQAPTIIPGTILENFGLDRPSRALLDAAARTGFLEVVDSLDRGWDSPIGVGGSGLSVGQRQRLALTRALVDDAPLVVLDEPTAHLDAVSEEEITRALLALKGQGKTVLVIAHRRALISLADTVIEVEARPASEAEIADHPELAAMPEAPADTRIDMPGILSADGRAAVLAAGPKEEAR